MLKKNKPTTPGRRHRVDTDTQRLSKNGPEKSLLVSGHKKRQGRGYKGRITMPHRGGGVKKRMRKIDWRRNKPGVSAVVKSLEYDPMRSANIALLFYQDGEKRYILAPSNMKIGDVIKAGENVDPKPGNTMPLKNIPVGMPIHNIELQPGRGAQLVRGAGVHALIQSKEGKYVTIQLPSKEQRLIHAECLATVGQIGNQDWKNRKLGKAGRKRLMGIRPTVRGTAQHPGSHPHGGGEGRSGVGLKYPKTAWGRNVAPGKKTRSTKKNTKWLVRDRRAK
jgi:large subunit ribosomal protein L2